MNTPQGKELVQGIQLNNTHNFGQPSSVSCLDEPNFQNDSFDFSYYNQEQQYQCCSSPNFFDRRSEELFLIEKKQVPRSDYFDEQFNFDKDNGGLLLLSSVQDQQLLLDQEQPVGLLLSLEQQQNQEKQFLVEKKQVPRSDFFDELFNLDKDNGGLLLFSSVQEQQLWLDQNQQVEFLSSLEQQYKYQEQSIHQPYLDQYCNNNGYCQFNSLQNLEPLKFDEQIQEEESQETRRRISDFEQQFNLLQDNDEQFQLYPVQQQQQQLDSSQSNDQSSAILSTYEQQQQYEQHQQQSQQYLSYENQQSSQQSFAQIEDQNLIQQNQNISRIFPIQEVPLKKRKQYKKQKMTSQSFTQREDSTFKQKNKKQSPCSSIQEKPLKKIKQINKQKKVQTKQKRQQDPSRNMINNFITLILNYYESIDIVFPNKKIKALNDIKRLMIYLYGYDTNQLRQFIENFINYLQKVWIYKLPENKKIKDSIMVLPEYVESYIRFLDCILQHFSNDDQELKREFSLKQFLPKPSSQYINV